MGITGRYNFPGIQKAVSKGLDALLAATSWGAWLLASPFKTALDALEGLATNWLVNRGLIIIDVGAVLVDGKVNDDKLNAALDDAFAKLKVGRDKITPADGAKIDAETDLAFDNFADIPTPAKRVSDVPNSSI